ncbi:MAG: radical SAM protein [Candidatus Korobacteraceae bacterium]
MIDNITRIAPVTPYELPVLGQNAVDLAAHPYLAVIIKPTYDCNLACEYCSVYGCEAAPRMSRETVDILMDRVTEFCGPTRTIFLIWHGGKPLLLPPEFYDYIGRRTQQYTGYTILNSVQTNATLLDQRFLDVFLKYGFEISISLDGPDALHDSGRKDTAGNGTFRTVMNAASLMQSKGLPVGGVAALTRNMIGRM